MLALCRFLREKYSLAAVSIIIIGDKSFTYFKLIRHKDCFLDLCAVTKEDVHLVNVVGDK